MADQRLDYNTQLKNKPSIPSLPIDYVTQVSNKPSIPTLPIDYVTNVTNKPTIYAPPFDYVTQITNKPTIPTLPTLAYVINSTYNFTPQAPGGSLVVGANVITLNPMPAGILVGSIGFHSLYISGGTGAAEVVPIIGWSSTTVVITCANTHSGAWTIQSATAGMQEAIYYAISIGVGIMFVQPGNIVTYGKTYVPDGISIRGCGAATALNPVVPSPGVFEFIGTFIDFQDLFIRYLIGTVSTMGTAVKLNGVNSGIIKNVKMWNPWTGIDLLNSLGVKLDNLDLSYCGAYGIHFKTLAGVGGILLSNSSIFVSNPGGVGIQIEVSSAGSIITGVQIGGGLRCIDLLANTADALNEIQLSNFWFDSFIETGLRITLNNAGAVCNRVGIRNGIISGSVNSNAILLGASVENQIANVMLENIDAAFDGTGSGIYLSGTKGAVLNNVNARTNNPSAAGRGLLLAAPANHNVQVNGGAFGVSVDGETSGAGVAGYGVYIDAAAHSLQVNGTKLGGSVALISNSSTDVNGIEFTDTCRPLPIPSVASGASVRIPEVPFFIVTGSAAVSGVTGLDAAHAGRSGKFKCSHATPGLWSGGNIDNAFTPAQNKIVNWLWDGTKLSLS